MTDREEFLQIFRQHVTRPGSEKLLDWLDHKTDFFSAPASTRFHGACTGGLCMHSLNVYHALHDTFFTEGESEESFAICALLHDLCKANYYKAGTRNVKNETTGQWEKVPSYSVEDLFPYGHGEKSVFLIERFMKLKVEEAVAIRWHMGGFDDAARGGCFAISEAYDKYPPCRQTAHRGSGSHLSYGAPHQRRALSIFYPDTKKDPDTGSTFLCLPRVRVLFFIPCCGPCSGTSGHLPAGWPPAAGARRTHRPR